MGEADGRSRSLDDVRGERRVERPGLDPGRLEDGHRRPSVRGDQEQRVVRRSAEPAEAGAQESRQRIGDRDCVGHRVTLSRSARELQCVEGVSARDLVQPEQRRSWERPPQRLAQQQLGRTDAQWPHLESFDGTRCKSVLDARHDDGLAETPRQEHEQRHGRQPSQREGQHARRGGVDPLAVVDRDDEGPLLGEQLQARSDGDPERAWVDCVVWYAVDQQRHLDRMPPRFGEQRQHALHGAFEEVGENDVREPTLDLRRSRRQHPVAAPFGLGDAGRPERGLPDARLALQHQGPRPAVGVCEERLEPRQLGVSADDSPRHRTGILTQRRRRASPRSQSRSGPDASPGWTTPCRLRWMGPTPRRPGDGLGPRTRVSSGTKKGRTRDLVSAGYHPSAHACVKQHRRDPRGRDSGVPCSDPCTVAGPVLTRSEGRVDRSGAVSSQAVTGCPPRTRGPPLPGTLGVMPRGPWGCGVEDTGQGRARIAGRDRRGEEPVWTGARAARCGRSGNHRRDSQTRRPRARARARRERSQAALVRKGVTSSVVAADTRSDIPVPRLSKTISREMDARRDRYSRAGPIVQPSSTWVTKAGTNTTSNGPSPTTYRRSKRRPTARTASPPSAHSRSPSTARARQARPLRRFSPTAR